MKTVNPEDNFVHITSEEDSLEDSGNNWKYESLVKKHNKLLDDLALNFVRLVAAKSNSLEELDDLLSIRLKHKININKPKKEFDPNNLM